ncbi:tetratricopeptide repeat protein [Streptomyces sp. HMX87]|uniref:tetratricopeptide repeat protein n=1 Tax=Streptomyces sp. HMX87 TaxID=3390849 RepID=UPI003A88ADB2
MTFGRTIRGRLRRSTVTRLLRLFTEGRYEEAEAEARSLAAAAARGRWRRSPGTVWVARAMAATAAVAHGRGAEVLPELEAVIAEWEHIDEPEGRALLMLVRRNRAAVLDEQGRHEEAEAEALDILRTVGRLAHHLRVGDLELSVLACLARALCGQGRHEEAEAIARGNLPYANGPTVASLHQVLVHSLNGQGRYEEALTEATRPVAPGGRHHSGVPALATAEALLGLGRTGEAEATARRALSDCERWLHPAHPRIAQAHALLTRITGG